MTTKNNIFLRNGSKEEKFYCKRYGIELHRIDNGITIVGISCHIDFTNWASINWDFFEGAYGNVPGSVHFLEHFFNKKIRSLAERNALKINAQTSNIEVKEIVSGIANPKVKDYGIWTVLDGIKNALESPLDNLIDIEKELETEKQVIKSEIQGRITNHNYHVNSNFCKTIYDPINPFFNIDNITGSEKDVDSIKIEDLRKIKNKVLVPKNLLISIYSEGDSSILKELVKILKIQYSNFSNSSKPKNKSTLKLQSKLNKKLKVNNDYKFETNIKNGIITHQFNWIFKYKFGLEKYFSLQLLKSSLQSELFAYSRKNGWGYFTEVDVTNPTDDISILKLRVDIKKDLILNIKPEINKILNQVKTRTTDIIELEYKRQLATSINVRYRFNQIINGLEIYNKIIDSDVMRQNTLALTSHNLDNLIDEIISTPPITIITGDLS